MLSLIKGLTNKYFIGGIAILIVLAIISGGYSYYENKIENLNKEIVTIKNKCTEVKDKLNYKVYQLERYKEELSKLIDKQNNRIDELKQRSKAQRSKIAQYVIKYDNIKEEKQKLIQQYRVNDNDTIKQINQKANQLIGDILWAE